MSSRHWSVPFSETHLQLRLVLFSLLLLTEWIGTIRLDDKVIGQSLPDQFENTQQYITD